MSQRLFRSPGTPVETVGEREREAAGRVNTMTAAFCVDCGLKQSLKRSRKSLLRQPEHSGQSRLRHVRARSLHRMERAEEGQGDLHRIASLANFWRTKGSRAQGEDAPG
jgi:hypothetical protein